LIYISFTDAVRNLNHITSNDRVIAANELGKTQKEVVTT